MDGLLSVITLRFTSSNQTPSNNTEAHKRLGLTQTRVIVNKRSEHCSSCLCNYSLINVHLDTHRTRNRSFQRVSARSVISAADYRLVKRSEPHQFSRSAVFVPVMIRHSCEAENHVCVCVCVYGGVTVNT